MSRVIASSKVNVGCRKQLIADWTNCDFHSSYSRAANAVVLHNHPSSLLAVYRMHFRYGRGYYGLEMTGDAHAKMKGDAKQLLHEWRRTVATYRRRGDLTPTDRLAFGIFGMVRYYALYRGYRSQLKTSRV